jgi:hypothetical protein
MLESVIQQYGALRGQQRKGIPAAMGNDDLHIIGVAKVPTNHQGFVSHIFGGVIGMNDACFLGFSTIAPGYIG